ncbi:MAG: type I pantothenate kinase [Luteitalea sp.]|nr:type I pantothenate kinase [Luteitalea sp.]
MAEAATTASRFSSFTREEWARLRDSMPLTLSEGDLESTRSLNDQVSMEEVETIYLPLSRLLNLYVHATQELYRATQTFLGNHEAKVPYVIGIAGSVAVGKSTIARLLQALLSRWPTHPRVDLITTDGFLYPNRVLEQRGLLRRKGFPESYDRGRLVRFMADLKAGVPEVHAPMYSHLAYDVVAGHFQVVRQPDVVIVEGLNVLEAPERRPHLSQLFVSDFFDFSIYVDADETDVERWYVERFLTLRDTVFQDPKSYFHRYGGLSRSEARDVARGIWRDINWVNLRENILPTRERAHLVLTKVANHFVQQVQLRRV